MDRVMIGFCGGKWGELGVGKTTATKFLVEKGFCLVSFLDPVERVAKSQCGWNGIKDQSGRYILDAVCRGGRKVAEDYWLNMALKSIPGDEDKIVFDDVYFANEHRFIKASGGWVIEILRPPIPDADLDFDPDASVMNKGGMDNFRDSVLATISQFKAGI
jgi:hypothetical protein